MAAGDTIQGTLTVTGVTPSFQPIANKGFNTFITGTWTGSVTLERSIDGGVTWNTVPKPDLTAATFTANINFEVFEVTANVLYRWNATVSSGSIGYLFST